MNFNVFVNFNGNCKEAITFYAEVFGQQPPRVMTFGDAPKSEGYEASEAEKDLVLYSELQIGDKNVMFSDCPPNNGYTCGNNICLVIGSKEATEIERLYNALKENGEVRMPLGKTFWSDAFGMVRDQFGVIWQLSLEK